MGERKRRSGEAVDRDHSLSVSAMRDADSIHPGLEIRRLYHLCATTRLWRRLRLHQLIVAPCWLLFQLCSILAELPPPPILISKTAFSGAVDGTEDWAHVCGLPDQHPTLSFIDAHGINDVTPHEKKVCICFLLRTGFCCWR